METEAAEALQRFSESSGIGLLVEQYSWLFVVGFALLFTTTSNRFGTTEHWNARSGWIVGLRHSLLLRARITHCITMSLVWMTEVSPLPQAFRRLLSRVRWTSETGTTSSSCVG